MQYRGEIDGLRALAVLPVILFHAGFDSFSGGFVGVDIFFVISGYLITTIINREIQEGTFSLARFYERRVRRILPALFFVCLACIPFAWLWMMPGEFDRFSKSLVAVNIFSSNFLFLRESGYFSTSSELKPLLHTWSLAVEEQFYVLFPLFLLLVSRLGPRVSLALLTVLALLSLGVSEWGARNYPTLNFYLLPTRAWELGVGAVLAIGVTDREHKAGWLGQTASSMGFCMVFSSFFLFDRFLPTPSLWALIPVLGTALILVFARQDTVVGKLLALKPIVGVGLVSYSAYLWHQPLFAFARIRQWDGISDGAYLGLSGLTLVLAYFSWRFIEQPFRNRSVFSRRMIFSGAAGCSVILIAFGLFGHENQGLPGRHGDKQLILNLEKRLRPNHGLSKSCNTEFKLVPECRTSETPEIVVWGDSHAAHLVDGIMASNPQAEVVQMTKSRCAPFLDIAPFAPPKNTENRAKDCLEFNRLVKNYISGSKSLKYAVLASPFTIYLDGSSQVYFEGKPTDSDVDFVVERFKATLDWLIQKGVTPVVFQSPPRNGRNVSLCLTRSIWFGEDRRLCRISVTDNALSAPKVSAFFEKIIEQNYQIVALKDYLCDDRDCMVEEDGTLIYRDGAHLSHEGSEYLGKKINFYSLLTSRE